jgi:Zn-dependent membrane protease YugP
MLNVDPTYFWYIFIPTLLISLVAQLYMGRVYARWSNTRNSAGLNGVQVSRQVISQAGLQPVSFERSPGSLTDHFDPTTQTVRLSDPVGMQASVVSMAVAAHELGHVQQYQNGSALIGIRNFLLPALQFSPALSYLSLLLGIILQSTGLIWIGIFFFALMVLFTILTLPVEFDASRRALKMLEEAGLIKTQQDSAGARAVLNAAALTYVAAAITSILQLMYYISLAQRRR